MMLAVPRSHPLWRRRRKVTLRELADEPFLLLRDGHCFREDVLKICKRLRLTPNVVFEGGQLETLIAMVGTGAGVTLLPGMAHAAAHLQSVGLIDFIPPRPSRTIGLVTARDKYSSPAAQAFARTLREVSEALTPAHNGSRKGGI
jgi:LysR family hydrogen peroxide-inducible transcriptional activator